MLRPILLYALVAKLVAAAFWLASRREAAIIFFFAPDPFILYALFVPSAQGLVRVFTRFVSDRPAVWLTIDDGPDENDTPRILDLLEEHRARATFFVIGERAARWPHLVTEITRRGHQVGHHTHTHPTAAFWCATPRQLAAELDCALDVLGRLGIRPQLFRAPVGIKHLFLARALDRRGLHCVGWTVRSGDCLSKSPERLVAGIARRLHSGAIILLHEGPSVSPAVRIKGIALLLDTLKARGFACEIPALHQLR